MNLKRATYSVILLSALVFSTKADKAYADPMMPTSGLTRAPIGHYHYCIANPAQCIKTTNSATDVALDQELWNELLTINDHVNTLIKPATDQEMHGRPELWSMPIDEGDCEDYVIMKRDLLMRAGWPASSLLITVVRDEVGDGHAVLTVRTDRGDFILDNKVSRVIRWDRTPYTYIKRQSEYNEAHWVSIMDQRRSNVGYVASR
jgi:predicted transglutaminase-like cysteine proteinase